MRMRNRIDKKAMEKHAERKNRPFYGILGDKVFYHSIYDNGDKREAFIIAIHDEDQGIVDLYLRGLEDSIHTIVENYIENGEQRHKIVINEKQFDPTRLISNAVHKDFMDITKESYWEFAR